MPNEVSRTLLREKGCFDFKEEKEKFGNQRQVKDEQERKQKEAEALQYFAKLDKNGDGYITKDELIFEVVLDQNNDGQVSDEEVNFYMSGHENYDEKTFLNSGWQLMKHLYSKYDKPVDEATTDDINTDTNGQDYDDLDDKNDEVTAPDPSEKIEGIEDDHEKPDEQVSDDEVTAPDPSEKIEGIKDDHEKPDEQVSDDEVTAPDPSEKIEGIEDNHEKPDEQVSGYPPEVQTLVNAVHEEFKAYKAYANWKIYNLERSNTFMKKEIEDLKAGNGQQYFHTIGTYIWEVMSLMGFLGYYGILLCDIIRLIGMFNFDYLPHYSKSSFFV